MTNFERLEKTRQLEKLKSDCLFYEYVSPVVEFLSVCGVMAVVGVVFGFETLLGSIVGFAALATSCVAVILKEKEAEKALQKITSQINQLNREFDEDAKEKDRQDIKQKTADKRISSSAVQTAQLKPTVQPESRVEKQTTSVDIDSIFDENGCLQSLDALGDIFGDDSSYSDDTPKVLRR